MFENSLCKIKADIIISAPENIRFNGSQYSK